MSNWYWDSNGPYNTKQDAIDAAQAHLDSIVERGEVIHDEFLIHLLAQDDETILEHDKFELTASDVEDMRVSYNEDRGEVYHD